MWNEETWVQAWGLSYLRNARCSCCSPKRRLPMHLEELHIRDFIEVTGLSGLLIRDEMEQNSRLVP